MKRTLTLFLLFSAGTGFTQRVQVRPDEAGKKVVITVDGAPFTSYYYPGPEVLKKPVLYPVYSASGALLTRGWPLDPRPGERVDHPHHVGIWFNYENVNGNDFWNNSVQVKRPGRAFGTILHTGINGVRSGKGQGTLSVTADWQDQHGAVLLKETSHYRFLARKTQRIIDRTIILTATGQDVAMPDVKDGMYAIRVARELEQPYSKPEILTGPDGLPGKQPVAANENVSGHYRTPNGFEGDAVWGKRAPWCSLSGKINGEAVSITLMDHPKNTGYPSYWHARGYGLFAINPLGQKALDKTASPLNFLLKKGESVTFRYRIVIDSAVLTNQQLNLLAEDFGRTK